MRHPSLRILGLCHVLLLVLGGGLALLALSGAPSLLRPSPALLGSMQIATGADRGS